ncbi:hypothetical protein NC653_028562 [Populus alba x Populus x berolinensis]|uniref:Uncharacterized protein n=1 Tax=Populus alba x Populus x berolinensis TaxID=444605 RepID=A0AAD6M002_9ROSI|nr:hypothetical protein NC653_028562 [Populus alba x Populus x berolinensis]
MLETVPSPAESPFCRTPKKSSQSARGIGWRFNSRCCICLNLVRWSRHLVIDFGLLGNRMYWSCQRFAGTGLVVVREGISTPNAPYLRLLEHAGTVHGNSAGRLQVQRISGGASSHAPPPLAARGFTRLHEKTQQQGGSASSQPPNADDDLQNKKREQHSILSSSGAASVVKDFITFSSASDGRRVSKELLLEAPMRSGRAGFFDERSRCGEIGGGAEEIGCCCGRLAGERERKKMGNRRRKRKPPLERERILAASVGMRERDQRWPVLWLGKERPGEKKRGCPGGRLEKKNQKVRLWEKEMKMVNRVGQMWDSDGGGPWLSGSGRVKSKDPEKQKFKISRGRRRRPVVFEWREKVGF